MKYYQLLKTIVYYQHSNDPFKMSTSKFVKTVSCAFCRKNGNPWNHPLKNETGDIICQELLNYKCPYCKALGHTTKHCPVLLQKGASKKVREEEQQQELKPAKPSNGWAAIAAKNIPPEVSAKIAEEDRVLKAQFAEKAAKAERLRQQRAQELYEEKKARREKQQIERAKLTFGLKEDFTIVYKSSVQVIPKGEFWYFHTECSADDTQLAKELRAKEENIELFKDYLLEKYHINYFERSEGTDDDCVYLQRERNAQRDREEEEYFRFQERLREDERVLYEECEEMKAKCARGEITSAQLEEFLYGDSWSDQEDYAEDGRRLYDQQYRAALGEAEWKARRAAVEKAKQNK